MAASEKKVEDLSITEKENKIDEIKKKINSKANIKAYIPYNHNWHLFSYESEDNINKKYFDVIESIEGSCLEQFNSNYKKVFGKEGQVFFTDNNPIKIHLSLNNIKKINQDDFYKVIEFIIKKVKHDFGAGTSFKLAKNFDNQRFSDNDQFTFYFNDDVTLESIIKFSNDVDQYFNDIGISQNEKKLGKKDIISVSNFISMRFEVSRVNHSYNIHHQFDAELGKFIERHRQEQSLTDIKLYHLESVFYDLVLNHKNELTNKNSEAIQAVFDEMALNPDAYYRQLTEKVKAFDPEINQTESDNDSDSELSDGLPDDSEFLNDSDIYLNDEMSTDSDSELSDGPPDEPSPSPIPDNETSQNINIKNKQSLGDYYQYGKNEQSRYHFFSAKYNGNTGDVAKAKIINKLKKKLESALQSDNPKESVTKVVTDFKTNKDSGWDVIKKGQGITTR